MLTKVKAIFFFKFQTNLDFIVNMLTRPTCNGVVLAFLHVTKVGLSDICFFYFFVLQTRLEITDIIITILRPMLLIWLTCNVLKTSSRVTFNKERPTHIRNYL